MITMIIVIVIFGVIQNSKIEQEIKKIRGAAVSNGLECPHITEKIFAKGLYQII